MITEIYNMLDGRYYIRPWTVNGGMLTCKCGGHHFVWVLSVFIKKFENAYIINWHKITLL